MNAWAIIMIFDTDEIISWAILYPVRTSDSYKTLLINGFALQGECYSLFVNECSQSSMMKLNFLCQDFFSLLFYWILAGDFRFWKINNHIEGHFLHWWILSHIVLPIFTTFKSDQCQCCSTTNEIPRVFMLVCIVAQLIIFVFIYHVNDCPVCSDVVMLSGSLIYLPVVLPRVFPYSFL